MGKLFNQFSLEEYFQLIDNSGKVNSLGLYRSIIENEGLSIEQKITVRDYAHTRFYKSFEFLQLKDPWVFKALTSLGSTLTQGDEAKIWEDIRNNQRRILQDKRIKHRSFGRYSKHYCGQEDCIWKGLMI